MLEVLHANDLRRPLITIIGLVGACPADSSLAVGR